MPARLEADIHQVLQAAMSLVSADGLKALTLRPLAERLDTTVSVLSYKFGRKDELVAAIIDAAREEDAAFLDLWLARIRAVAATNPALMAEFADAILDDMARNHAVRSQFYCELLQGVASRPELVAPFSRWRAQRLTFWRAATERLDRPELAETLHAYCADEVVHGLALGDQAAYRWLRRLALKRLCCGLIASDGAEGQLFAVFHAALGDLLASPDGRYAAPRMSEWQAGVAGHISALIIAEGADAVTHRAVAERAGVASSTLAYHFPRQDDLLKSGLDDIIIRLQGHVDRPAPATTSRPAPDRSREEIARATFAIALAAARNPSLRGIAADMRRRRGENLHVYLRREAGGVTPFDLLAAQVMSIASIGQLMLTASDTDRAGADFELVGRMMANTLVGR